MGSTIGILPPNNNEERKELAKQRQSGKVWTTPYCRLKGHLPSLRHLKVFGCRAFMLREPTKGRAKLETLVDKGWLIGPARYARGFIVFIPNGKGLTSGKYKISRNVRVDEYLLPRGRVSNSSPTTPPDDPGGVTSPPANPPTVEAWAGPPKSGSYVTWATAAPPPRVKA